LSLLDSTEPGPINIGNPVEFTMLELADLVIELTGTNSGIEYRELPSDDPRQRQPDIAAAKALLGWEPKIDLREGLERSIPYFAEQLANSG
ncbi:MAG: SDR family NAD-dependent epimerase/dehydratase, partial [Ilumatobacteraceae bacterium]|nr:SDR family NAD-dependent epimerase/dehydratase [Ilumatobacteraceae bacterium]